MQHTMEEHLIEHELVKELLDDQSPFFMVHPTTESSSNFLAPALVYSGPTVEDIESALSYAKHGIHDISTETALENRISLLAEGGQQYLNKDDNAYRYTLRIKSCTNAMADDGYKWRKYGQKSIKNSPNPRSYYRCTNPRCSAKRQVERSMDDPDTLVITYEGLHFHFDYPFFMLDNPQEMDPPTKKQRGTTTSDVAQHQAHYNSTQSEGWVQGVAEKDSPNPITGPADIEEELSIFDRTQGLLEDMVPMMIRKPSHSSSTASSASLESYEPSTPASSNSFSWSPETFFPGFI